MKKAFIFLFVLFFSFGNFLNAQQFPPSVKWKEMKTPILRIVYPEYLESYAWRIARYYDSLDYQAVYPFHKPDKPPLVLNPYTAVSNGYAFWYPQKMEWLLQPSAECGFSQWYKQLAVHEYRHIVQFNAINKNTVKLFHILNGFEVSNFASRLFIPDWFLEGDAVFIESLLLRNGMVRSGFINMPMYMVAGEYPSHKLDYYRMYYGSYNRFYPNHYSLGYFMVKNINNVSVKKFGLI